jgi:beta-phosphoglucomutase
LKFLKENNQPIALGSASKMLAYSRKLESLAILTPLLAMMLQMQTRPEVFLIAAKQLGITPENAIVLKTQ